MRLGGCLSTCLGVLSLAVVPLLWAGGADTVPGTTAAAASLLPSLLETSNGSSYIGLLVGELRFPAVASAIEQKRLQSLVPQHAGQPLDRELVRRSISALHATGRYADIRVEADRMKDGTVALIFLTTPNYFIGRVNIEGAASRPSANQVTNSMKLQLGELFTADKLERGLRNVQQLMEEHGFYQSTIQVEQHRHPETQQIDFVVHMTPGPQAKIGALTITGNPGYSKGQVEDITDMRTGDYVSQQRITNALSRLRKKYQEQERWLAQVTITKALYRANANAVDYTLDVKPGPTVQIETEGFKVSRRQLKKNVPVYEENALDDDLLNEGRRNLLNYMQVQGYFDAKVTLRRRGRRAENMTVLYVIEPGAVHKVVKVNIEGAKNFPETHLRTMMQVQPAGRLLSHGRYTQGLLARDVRAMEDLYQNNGFEQVKIATDVQDNYGGQQNDLAINVQVHEGPQTLVRSFHIVGAESAPKDLLANLNTGDGQPFSTSRIAEDREIVLNSYFNRGFPQATFEAAATAVQDQPTRKDVTYTVHEGAQIFVDRVLVSGLNYTRPHVVDRELQMKSGESLNQIDMLRTQQSLYDLGIFGQVDTAVQNPTGDEETKNVLVQIQEAKRYTFNYGVGLEFQTGQPTGGAQGETGVSPRASFSVTRLNFRGRNHTLTFKTNVGRLQQRALVSTEIPRWFNSKDWKLTITAFYDKTVDVSTFTSDRLEGAIQAQQTIGKASTMVYSYTYRRVRADNVAVAPDQIPLLSQPVRVGIPGFSYIRDRRDNPLESTKGNYTTVDGGIASGYFGSEANFGRFLLQNSTYHAFGKNRQQEKKFVFARSIRIGLQNPFGNTITIQPGEHVTNEHQTIPLAERFLSGGGNSHRGFGLNQAGPRDPVSGAPLGGSALLLNNFELRFPAVALPFVQDNMSFALFHDAGNVFTNGNDMLHSLTHWSQRDFRVCQEDGKQGSCNYNYISQAIGVGIRYKTPVGPVRFDFGYNLNAPRFPSCVATGATGQATSTFCSDATFDSKAGKSLSPFFSPQQARRFNVSFSIGQTF